MSTPSLFDAFVETDNRWHSMLPNFSIACDVDWLSAPDGKVLYVLGTRNAGSKRSVDCPACIGRYGGLDGLRREIRAQQSRQASA